MTILSHSVDDHDTRSPTPLRPPPSSSPFAVSPFIVILDEMGYYLNDSFRILASAARSKTAEEIAQERRKRIDNERDRLRQVAEDATGALSEGEARRRL